VITDLMMPDVNGIQLLETMQTKGYEVPVLMITGYPTIRTALEALRLGAVDYVSKPFTRQELLAPVHRTLRRGTAPAAEASDGTSAAEATDTDFSQLDLNPGDRYRLREHSWAVYQQGGLVKVGIEESFLEAIDTVASLEVPGENDIVEQGLVGFKLKTTSGEDHNVFVPLSGQVVKVNQDALEHPSSVAGDTWLLLVLPNRLDAELPLLLRC
jgi:glycine cleavage system H lipoate-binding protein